jgi:hypothetical protein
MRMKDTMNYTLAGCHVCPGNRWIPLFQSLQTLLVHRCTGDEHQAPILGCKRAMFHPRLPISIGTFLPRLSKPRIRQVTLHNIDLLDIGVHKYVLCICCPWLPPLQQCLSTRRGVFIQNHFVNAGLRLFPISARSRTNVVKFHLLHRVRMLWLDRIVGLMMRIVSGCPIKYCPSNANSGQRGKSL